MAIMNVLAELHQEHDLKVINYSSSLNWSKRCLSLSVVHLYCNSSVFELLSPPPHHTYLVSED